MLIDARDGVKLAREQGLFVTGTLGVFQTAAHRELVSLADAPAALSSTNFRHSEALFEQLLREHRTVRRDRAVV